MKFQVEIDSNNVSVTAESLAEALIDVASHVKTFSNTTTFVIHPIKDLNGNTIGTWIFDSSEQ